MKRLPQLSLSQDTVRLIDLANRRRNTGLDASAVVMFLGQLVLFGGGTLLVAHFVAMLGVNFIDILCGVLDGFLTGFQP